MADNEIQDKKEEEEKPLLDKNDNDEDSNDPGCCFHYGQCVLTVIKAIWAFFAGIVMSVANCLGYCWYPMKERAGDYCDCCGKRMNPESDPSYGGF